MAGEVQLAGVKGVIDLEDKYSSVLDTVFKNVFKFSDDTKALFGGVSIAGAAVVATFTAIGAAAVELGNRGANVNDVAATLDHFAGSAQSATLVLDALRQGTLHTVDDFELMKDASHLLSTGVKLTADDFGTLGSAAFVLQNRGLGGTKEMLELVSNALVTGRTKALSMALGVIDAGDAEEKYAKQLGVKKDELTDLGKVEAKRIAVLEMLRTAVKDAGAQERDFGEQIEAARTFVVNWVDDIGRAVAVSPVLSAGMKEVGLVISEAFGGDKESSIKAVVGLIESTAVGAANLALAAVETARVFNVGWSLIKTTVYGVEFAVMGVVAAIGEAVLIATEAAEKLHLVSPETVANVREFQTQVKGTTIALLEETGAAAKGIVGNSDFDRTLDKLGGTIFRVKDAMTGATTSTKAQDEVTKVAVANAAKLAAVQKQVSDALVDRQKIEDSLWKIEEKSLTETTALWNEYFVLRTKHGGTAGEAQKAEIQKWFDDEVAKLDASDRNWKNHYDALAAVAKEKLRGTAVDWDYISTHSISALREIADKARNTYYEMALHAGNFTREELEKQRLKMIETADEVRGLGKAFVDAENAAAAATAKANEELAKQKKAADEAKAAMMAMGNTEEVTSQNFAEKIKSVQTTGGWNPSGIGSNISDATSMALAKKGYSFQEIIDIQNRSKTSSGPIPPPHGPRIPGFKDGVENFSGGSALVGEAGPEIVDLPRGSNVSPLLGGTSAAVDGINVVVQMNISGVFDPRTRRELLMTTKEELMKGLKSTRQFRAA